MVVYPYLYRFQKIYESNTTQQPIEEIESSWLSTFAILTPLPKIPKIPNTIDSALLALEFDRAYLHSWVKDMYLHQRKWFIMIMYLRNSIRFEPMHILSVNMHISFIKIFNIKYQMIVKYLVKWKQWFRRNAFMIYMCYC